MNSFRSFCKFNVFTSVQKEVWIGWVSSLVEAYNMAIYSFLAPFLAKFLFHNTKNAVFFSYALVLIASSFLYPLETASWNVFIKSQWQKIGSVVLILAFFIVSYTYIFIFLPLIYLEGYNS